MPITLTEEEQQRLEHLLQNCPEYLRQVWAHLLDHYSVDEKGRLTRDPPSADGRS